MCRWWAEVVVGVPRWMCFDACPTAACLPYVAARAKALTPHAKLVVMASHLSMLSKKLIAVEQ